MRVLGVSEAGYYAWRHRLPSAHALADAALLKRVRTIHASSRETYGALRVPAELRAGGEKHDRQARRAPDARSRAGRLAVVLDAWSRKPNAEGQSEIVGWSMANHLRAELVLDALEMAPGQRRPHNVVLHSDQGCQ